MDEYKKRIQAARKHKISLGRFVSLITLFYVLTCGMPHPSISATLPIDHCLCAVLPPALEFVANPAVPQKQKSLIGDRATLRITSEAAPIEDDRAPARMNPDAIRRKNSFNFHFLQTYFAVKS
jgi:hypothetical protein